MNDASDYWQRIVDGLKGHGFRFRVKWTGDDNLAGWSNWVVCPSPGYLESGCGPVAVREVEWLDIAITDTKGADQRSEVFAALASIGVNYHETPESIQVRLDNG